MGLSQSSKANANSQPIVPPKVLVEDPGKQISQIRREAQGLRIRVDSFSGKASDNEYRYLDEMLTSCILRLDNIDTGGIDEIRQARKSAVVEIQSCITILESKVDLPSGPTQSSSS